VKLLIPNSQTGGTLRRQFAVEDDFVTYVTGDVWSSVVTDSGTVATLDAAGGILRLLPSDGTIADNDEAYVKSTKEVALFAVDKPLAIFGRIKITEANVDDSNVAFGCMDAVAADSILDNGGGPKASYSGAVIFKADGDTYWSVESSIGATQTTNKTSLLVSSGAFVDFRIEAQPVGSDVFVTYFADGTLLRDFTTNEPIKHTVALGTPTEMNVFAGVKNGGANQETLDVDYIAFTATR
jgi:hypothetical protein